MLRAEPPILPPGSTHTKFGVHVLDIPPLCSDLSPISFEHHALFESATDADRKAYQYYFPFIYLNGMTGRNWIYLFEQVGDSVLLYELRNRRMGLELNLVAPPFPFTDVALRHAEERMRVFNGPRGWRIRVVQENDALMLARRNLSITFRESEYIYDRAAVLAAEGPEFSALRAKLSRARRAGSVTRRYTAADQLACLGILEGWKERLKAEGMRADGYRYTAKCLEIAEQIPASLMCGQVIEVEGQVHAFAFGGPVNRMYGALYITIADNQYQGHAQLLRTGLMSAFPDLAYFNDTVDSGRPGLRDLKLRFRPVEMLNMYEAHSEGRELRLDQH